MKLHTLAESGPWIPDPNITPKAPPPVQVPKPYVLVMLKGFCTEFFETPQQMDAFAQRLRERNKPFQRFRFDALLGQYCEYIEFWQLPAGELP